MEKEILKLYEKIFLAKNEILNTEIKKEGKNTHSKYSYFTPSQVEKLVQKACHNQKLLTAFNITKGESGLVGTLTIYDIETGCRLEYKMVSEIPQLASSNVAQKLGGAMTYTERYLKTSAFGITDNSLDLDDNSQSVITEKEQPKFEKRQITAAEVKSWNGKIYKDKFIYISNVKIEPPQDQIDRLKESPKYIKTEKK